MATAIPTSGWSSTVTLTGGERYLYTVTPGAGGSVRMQWSPDNSVWYDFTNNLILAPVTGEVPAAANYLRGTAFVSAGTFDTEAVTTPVYVIFWGVVADEAAMVALTLAVPGDEVYRTDTTSYWKLRTGDPATAGNWDEIGAGAGATASYVGAGSITAITTEADPVSGGFRPSAFTQDGIEQLVSYNVNGSRAGLAALAGQLLTTYAYTVDGDFAYVAGNYAVCGAYRMTWAQAKAIKAGLAALGAAAVGFRALVTDLAVVYDAAGVALSPAPPTILEWAGTYWRAPNGVTFASHLPGTYSNAGAGTSGTLHTLVVPQELVGPYGWLEFFTPANFFADNESQSKQVNVLLNGTPIVNATSAAVTQSSTQVTGVVQGLGSVSSQYAAPVNSANVGSWGSGNVPILPAINSDTTDLTFTTQLQTTSASGGGTALTLYMFRVTVRHP